MSYKDKTKQAEYNKEYNRVHRTEILEHDKEYYQTHKLAVAESQMQFKIDILARYGNGKCACVICGDNGINHLSINRIHGGGAKHKRDNHLKGGGSLYRWLRNNNYPQGFQTLCMNCQFDKRFEDNE